MVHPHSTMVHPHSTMVHPHSTMVHFYGIVSLFFQDLSLSDTSSCIEVIETAHPEKVGVCSARLIINEDHGKIAPIAEMLERLSSTDAEFCQGSYGRYWIRTDLTRLDWAEKLLSHGWSLAGTTSFIRRLPDITGRGTDLCHVVDKWIIK